MAVSRGDVVYQKGQSDDSDIWDDTALIKAYDKAVTSFKTALKNGTATCESPQDLRGDKVREQAGEDTETAQEEQRVALRQGECPLRRRLRDAMQTQGWARRTEEGSQAEAERPTVGLPVATLVPSSPLPWLSTLHSAQKWHRTCESPKTYGETKSVNKRAKTRRRHKRSSVSPSDKWRPGDLCQAAWSEDGVVYDATIKSVDASAGTCVVVFTGHGNEDELKLADLPPATESAAAAGGESDAAASCDADSASRAGKESAPSADDYEMPGRPKGGHGAWKKGHKQKQSVPPWAYPSPPLSHPPPFPGFPPYSDDSDIWHNAALIKAYDKAVTSFKRSKMAPHLREPQDLRGDKVREQAGEDTETAQEEQHVALRQDYSGLLCGDSRQPGVVLAALPPSCAMPSFVGVPTALAPLARVG
ncbi:uncharacterized protein LOC142922647 isoform X2 [Petromyzon marinus]|uniref:uncharacterized protein LOC142922647 isoform X2 n=1 Tax=Petromyzon marinus TaxID=7757 RepID=UPI003F706C8C